MTARGLSGAAFLDGVAELLRETAAVELMPRFGRLEAADIREKRPGDLVTVADEAAERRISAGLARIAPEIPVIGEEAVAADPRLLTQIEISEFAWLVDPLDGTTNFTNGSPAFTIIVCLVHHGVPVAGWILHPVSGRMAVAEQGAGICLDGVAKKLPTPPPMGTMQGFTAWGFLRRLSAEPGRRATLAALGQLGSHNCVGLEYVDLLAGDRHFSCYRWTKPWDHAAGALMLREAGGLAAQFDGAPYVATQPADSGIITAPDQATWQEIKHRFLGTLAEK